MPAQGISGASNMICHPVRAEVDLFADRERLLATRRGWRLRVCPTHAFKAWPFRATPQLLACGSTIRFELHRGAAQIAKFAALSVMAVRRPRQPTHIAFGAQRNGPHSAGCHIRHGVCTSRQIGIPQPLPRSGVQPSAKQISQPQAHGVLHRLLL
jgi:hypothetical protein